MRRKMQVALTFIFIAAALPITAFAHAKMTMSAPKDGAAVEAGLSEIQLKFSSPMRLTAVRVTNAEGEKDGRTETPLKSQLPKSFEETVTVLVDPLAAGAYEVSWTAVADDGHVMNGSFKFTVMEAKNAQPAQ